MILEDLYTRLKKEGYVVDDINLYITKEQESKSDEYKPGALVMGGGI